MSETMDVNELAVAVVEQLQRSGRRFVRGQDGACIPAVLATIYGSVDNCPVRLDFVAPPMTTDGRYFLNVFDLRTKQEIGTSSSTIGALDALGLFPWRSAMDALFH